MKRYVIAAVLIVAFAAPAFAIDYYVALRLGGGGCKVMMLTPNPKKFKVIKRPRPWPE